MTNWKEKLIEVFEKTGDSFDKIESTLTNEEFLKEFDAGLGNIKGIPFTAWSEKYVYFPVVYDGIEYVGFVPRNPCDIKTIHWGNDQDHEKKYDDY